MLVVQITKLDITLYLMSKPAAKKARPNLDFRGFEACILRRGAGARLDAGAGAAAGIGIKV